jgi:para-nitrobenzyl esterase
MRKRGQESSGGHVPERLTRRCFVGRMGGLAVGTSGVALPGLWLPVRTAFGQDTASGTVVETSAGRVRGTTRSGIHIFKGIRYGAPTGGANRFMPPMTPTPWSGVRDAFDYGAAAPQGIEQPVKSEDCLFLNLWTPAVGDGGRRPVMVWLHGGGFREGSGSSPTYDGVNLCSTGDVVLITINHRVSIFGSAYLAEIAGDDFAASGCAGMLDIVAALEWVRDNIAAFGGDPETVTVFGESGGGRKVTTLLAMPGAQGLFHRAIIQSGAILRVRNPHDATREVEMVMSRLGLRASQGRELQRVPTDALLDAYLAIAPDFKYEEHVVGMTANTPVLDGNHIPRHPFDPTAPAMSADVPVLVGYNRTEETFYWRDRDMPLGMSGDELSERIAALLRSATQAPHVVDVYRQAYPDARPWDLFMLISTDYPRGMYARELAERKSAQGAARTWLYRFDWDMGGELKTPHALDIRFVFNNIDHAESRLFQLPGSPESRALAAKMSAAWMAFARSGDPNTPSLPDWPAYTTASRPAMLLDNDSRVVHDHDREPRLAMEAVLGVG